MDLRVHADDERAVIRLLGLPACFFAVREGASIKAVSKYLGYSSTAITMDMYVHASLEKMQKVRRQFDRGSDRGSDG